MTDYKTKIIKFIDQHIEDNSYHIIVKEYLS